ncbi:MAG: MBL fold metallo-hydrolase [Candidatus Bipolaricaulota bacterium]
MRFCTLGSGSTGNAALIEGPDGPLLVDVGLSWRETMRRAARAGVSTTELGWIVLTHEHADHVRGLDTALRRGLRVAASQGTLRALGVEGVALEPGLELAGIKLTPFPVSHDAAQPVGLRLDTPEVRLALISDLGRITPEVLAAMDGCTHLFIEANHDTEMLLAGPYPWPIKMRILGPNGHLANEETARTLARLGPSGPKAVLLAHLSQENNSPARALEAVARALNGSPADLYLSYPDRPSSVVGS